MTQRGVARFTNIVFNCILAHQTSDLKSLDAIVENTSSVKECPPILTSENTFYKCASHVALFLASNHFCWKFLASNWLW